MDKNKTLKLVAALVCAIVGSVTLLVGLGYVNLPSLSAYSVTPGGLGLSMSSSKVNVQPIYSTVAGGYEYKWRITVSNTGNVAWTSGWVNVRLGTTGSTAVQTTCAATPSSCVGGNVGGSFMVEQCASGIDVAACREDIRTTWALGFSDTDGSWKTVGQAYPGGSPSTEGIKVVAIDVGNVAPGTSKTVWLRLKVPGSASGNYPFIVQAMAWSGAVYAIAGTSDTLSVGTISGNIAAAFVGILSMLGAAGFAISAFV